MLNKSSKKAFSLIEISIVILIVGILVAGFSSGSNLYYKFKLQTAQALTKSSAVNGIRDLALWYETSLDESFSSGQNVDNSNISTWIDINPQKPIKNNATQSTASSCSACPQFKESIINGLPVINFDGSGKFLSIADPSIVVGTDYTLFIVGSRTSNSDLNFFIASTVSSGIANTMLHFGYRGDTVFRFGQLNNDLSLSVSGYSQQDPSIFVGGLKSSEGKRIFINNATSQPSTSNTQKDFLTSNSGMTIGNYINSYYLKGYVAEIIIFSRYLKDEERIAVTNYLSKKYAIKVTSS